LVIRKLSRDLDSIGVGAPSERQKTVCGQYRQRTETRRKSMSEPMLRYELWQGGICVASASGPDRQRVLAEIMHYAMQYSQDGECHVLGPYAEKDGCDCFPWPEPDKCPYCGGQPSDPQ
jgi:hypothetical protein